MVVRESWISTLIKKKEEFTKDLSVNELIEKLKQIHIQETNILEQIEIAIEAERLQGSDTQESHFAVKDRVIITNHVRAPKGEFITPSNRHRKVTRVVRETNQVYFTTNNGTKTWRLAKNLKKQEE